MECREWPTKRIIAAKVNRIEILDAADGKSLLTFASDNMMSAARFSPDDARIVATVP